MSLSPTNLLEGNVRVKDLSIPTLLFILKSEWFKNRRFSDEWINIFLAGIKKLEESKDKNFFKIPAKKYKDSILKNLNEFKSLLKPNQQTLLLELKSVEISINGWKEE